MSGPAAPADVEQGFQSLDEPTKTVRVQEGDWEVESSSRELPSEESLRQSLREDEPTPTDDRFELEDGTPANAAEAVEQERRRREKAEKDAAEGQSAKDTKDAAGKASKPLTKRVEQERERLKQTRFERGQEERRLAAIRQEIADLEAKRTAPPKAGERPVPTERPTWKQYDADGKDFDDFTADLERYLEAKTDARREADRRAELKAAEAEAQAAHEATFHQSVAEKMEAARAAHPDYDEAITVLDTIKSDDALFLRDAMQQHEQGGEIAYFLAKNMDAVTKPLLERTLTYPMMDALRETTNPTGFLHYLAAHADEAERIARLSPASALVALGRIVARLEDAPAGSSTPARPVTKAVPPPAARVDGSRSVAGSPRDADEDGIAWDMG